MTEPIKLTELVHYRQDGDVAVISIENPPVNALSPGVPEGIGLGIEKAAADASVKAVVIIGGGRTFIAGADIKEFGKMTSGQKKGGSLLPLLLAIEDCTKPVVMAIHGTAFGGGLEVAMAGHYRVAAPTAQVGQPEVKLGIIPGAAGTQRLPRLAGVAVGAEMCAFGDPVPAKKALEFGIVDKLIEGDLLTGAVAFAREAVGKPAPKTRDRNEKLAGDHTAVFAEARSQSAKRMRGQKAPLAAIDAVEAATKLSFADGCQKEAELFQKCLFDDQSKSLIHAFFGERAVAKIPGLRKDAKVMPIAKAAVIGAGTMGGGIAMVYANAGIPVVLKETKQEFLDKGLATIRKNYENSAKKGRFTMEEVEKRMALITPTLSYDDFKDVDIIVEAVFENMALKKEIFAAIDQVAKPDCILASNTSTLDVDEIASATKRPHMVIGHHFFSPANVMRLLEIVRGKATNDDVIATSMELSKKLKKVGVLVGNCHGFVGNRMFAPYTREANFLAEEGAPVAQIDKALYNWGMAMGPLAVEDLAGIDVGWRIRQEIKHLRKPGVRYVAVQDQLAEMGHFGQKTGAGWYKYDENRRPGPHDVTEKLLKEYAAQQGFPQRTFTDEEIIERIIYSMVNEGAKILDEGIALRAVDIDIVYLNGYGFPAWRGGPMWYADTVGLDKVLAKINELRAQFGDEYWTPAPLLEKLVAEGKKFADFDKAKETAAASA
jgi:3-hydroxyacyl-CoA dehydrogenase